MDASLMTYIRHLQRWDSGTIRLLGVIELILAIGLAVCAIYAFTQGDDVWMFGYVSPVLLVLGLFQVIFFSGKSRMTPALGILLLAEMWAISFLVSAIPFVIYGADVLDALFEGISGYTTTGATVFSGLDDMPKSLLLWRGIIQWCGGITVLISFSFLLPLIGMAGSSLNSNGMSGSDTEDYSQKVTSASLNFLIIYALLTGMEVFCLYWMDVPLFDCVCIAMSNVPTGGLLPSDSSMADYNIWAQEVTLVFMVLGATNFYMMFRAIFKKDGHIVRNKETIFMLKWFLLCSVLIFLCLLNRLDWNVDFDEGLDVFWDSLYMTVSSGTGTGFAIIDFTGIPAFVLFVLLILEFMGGCSGSTAGGIKIYRMMALTSYIRSNMHKVMHPNAVISIRADGKNISEESVGSALSTVFLFLIGIFVSLGLILIFEPDLGLQDSFGTILAAITNAGIGPMGGCYETLTGETKILMCILMWFGRMEMILVLIMFTRSYWSDVRLSFGQVKGSNLSHLSRKKN